MNLVHDGQIIELHKHPPTRAAELDAAVRATLARPSFQDFDRAWLFKNWLAEPSYFIPIHTIRAEYRRITGAY